MIREINLANVDFNSESEKTDAFQQLIQREMKASNCSYETAWNRVGATEDGKAILGAMVKSDANLYTENSPQGKAERDALARQRAQSGSGVPGAADTDMQKAMLVTQKINPKDIPAGGSAKDPGKAYPKGFAAGPQITTMRAHGADI